MFCHGKRMKWDMTFSLSATEVEVAILSLEILMKSSKL